MVKGLYVHIPFCNNVCGYCDFAKSKYNKFLVDKYLLALNKELDTIKQDEFYSVYIGGGTPTSLDESQLETLLKMISRFEVKEEYTIEINPETFTLRKAELIKQYGVNRVSIGIQSFNEKLLEHMNRSHRDKDVKNTFEYLDAVGIKNRSIDLMYGFNIQTMEDLLSDLKTAVESDITHISIYDLEVHDTTLFGINHYEKLDDETDGLMYQTICEYLNDHSFIQYETSNFAFGKYQSKHNKLYWHYEDFYGVGLSASGKIKDYRYENTHNFVEYLNGNYVGEKTYLSDDDKRFEAVMMGLRLIEGICIDDFNNRFKCDLLAYYAKPIEKYSLKKLLEISDGYLKTTIEGKYYLNDILVDFMD